MNDGRPCTADAFIAALIKDDDVPYGDIHHALSAWNEGAWEEALSLLMPEDREELLADAKKFPAPFTIMIEDIAELDILDKTGLPWDADGLRKKMNDEIMRIRRAIQTT